MFASASCLRSPSTAGAKIVERSRFQDVPSNRKAKIMIKAGWMTSALGLGFACTLHAAAAVQPTPRIATKIDNAARVTLVGNVRPEAIAKNDLGVVADSMPLNHMQLLLQRSSAQEVALASAIDALHDPKSSTYHQWLTAEQFGAQYGVAQSDIATVTQWLTSQGFKVNQVQSNAMTIDFSGTAGTVRQAFGTEIHRLSTKGAKHFANMSDPQIPAALAPVVRGIVSLNDFRPQPLLKRKTKPVKPLDSASGSSSTNVGPADLATIYNFKPIFSGGNTGQGQTIVVVEDTDVYSAQDWTTFRSTFGLSGYAGSFVQMHPVAVGSASNNCTDPGVNANAIEAEVDAEWASAAAPSAKIVVAACADTSTLFGGLIAVQNLIASKAPPAIISISYGECEMGLTSTGNAAYSAAYQQAVAEGVSVFVSAGDDGAASCDAGNNAAYNGITVSGMASTAYNVAVGGTDFADTSASKTSTYWNGGAAVSYIPEIPWNNSCAGSVLLNYLHSENSSFPTVAYGSSGLCDLEFTMEYALNATTAGSGGPSNCASGSPTTDTVGLVNGAGSCKGTSKPSWQSGVYGIPGDGVRDIPDVSMFAANGLWNHAYVECYSDIANGGSTCTGTPDNWTLLGGTSVAAPIMAGVQALINHNTGSAQGNPNVVYYALAAAEYGSGGSSSCNSSNGNSVGGSCIFYDVTQGDNVVNCYGYDCYGGSGTEVSGGINNIIYGVLSTSSTTNSPAYKAQAGWDFATGIGTVNVANLVNAWGSK
jgi:subtilase family serine protease